MLLLCQASCSGLSEMISFNTYHSHCTINCKCFHFILGLAVLGKESDFPAVIWPELGVHLLSHPGLLTTPRYCPPSSCHGEPGPEGDFSGHAGAGRTCGVFSLPPAVSLIQPSDSPEPSAASLPHHIHSLERARSSAPWLEGLVLQSWASA